MNVIKLESYVGDVTFISEIDDRKWEVSRKWADTTHFHVNSEIHIILSGNAVIEIDGEDVEVFEGDICVLAPGTSHYPKRYSEDLEKTNFYFSLSKKYLGEKIKRNFSEYLYYGNIFKSLKSYFIFNDKELVSVIKKLLTDGYSQQTEHIFSIQLALFYITVASHIKDRMLPENDQHIGLNAENENLFRQRIIVEEFFQKRYNEEVGIDDLAKALCLSASHTNRIVKRVFNEGFKKTLMKQRIDHACMLIKQKELTLNEIAYQCGYTSYNGFLAAFKSHVGKTPKEYEKSVR